MLVEEYTVCPLFDSTLIVSGTMEVFEMDNTYLMVCVCVCSASLLPACLFTPTPTDKSSGQYYRCSYCNHYKMEANFA